MRGVLSRPLNHDLEGELPRSRIIGKLSEDFGTRSSAGGSEEVVILLHFPTMLFDWVGQPRKENFSKQNRKIAGNGGAGVYQRTVCRMGSFNCHTLLPWRRHELAAYVIKDKVDILDIQEHRIHFEEDGDPVRCFALWKGWMLLAASASPTGVARVGFIVSSRVGQAIYSYNMVSPRVLYLQLSSDGQLKPVMFSVYSPTSSLDLREADSFYHCLFGAI